jgi:beta-phosphoglucomutase family hydrolase
MASDEMTHRTDEHEARAVLWDLDGTIIDSIEYHWRAWRETLARENHPLTRAQFESTFGWRNDEILRQLFGRDISRGRIARISEAKEQNYRVQIAAGGIAPLPGVERWLKKLRRDSWRQAIASSAPPANIAVILKALNFAEHFDAVVSAEDIERGKPDPQIFLLAAEKLNVSPARSIVVEDAPAGIEGARRARMRSIGVLTTHQSLDANLTVRSLDELPDDAFEKLLDC